MTVDEIIAQAETMVEESYDPSVWEDWVQAILDDLTPMAKVLTETEVSLTITNEEATINLVSSAPTLFELIGISLKPTGKRKQKLRKLPAYDSVSLGWIRYNTTVKLQNLPVASAKAVVEYYQKLAMTAVAAPSTDHTINLPEEYHDIVVKGICALAMQKEEEQDRKNDFYGEYTLGKRRMISERTMAMEPWNAVAMRGGAMQ